MDSLFGEASTAIATPATMSPPAMRPEAGSLIRTGSPVASLDLRGRPGTFDADSAIPGLGIDPANANPVVDGGKPQYQRPGEGGIRGWLSSVVNRGNSPSGSSTGGASYAPLGQRDD
ncbi:MAG: hypothetical protein OK454_07035 [Thaumarchaeota archaeon]|nr:hypothetical protein [Nitrososphaerota archaeon]